MCQYEYYQFDICGHRSIEITEYCNETLWKAGMTAQLHPCPEQNFVGFCIKIINIPCGDIGQCYWRGMSGYCRMCEEKFKMPKAAHSRTYNDQSFTDVLANATPLFNGAWSHLRVPAPLDSIARSPTQNCDVPDALQHALNAPPAPAHDVTPPSDPTLLSRRLLASGSHPYIYAPYLNANVMRLLSVDDQIPDNKKCELKEMFFPGKFQWFDLSNGHAGTQEQFRSKGLMDAIPVSLTHPYLSRSCGLTPKDDALVVDSLRRGIPLQTIWRDNFKYRGMSIQPFWQHGLKLEEYHINGRAVKDNSRMQVIQKDLANKWESADGITPFGMYQRGSFD